MKEKVAVALQGLELQYLTTRGQRAGDWLSDNIPGGN